MIKQRLVAVTVGMLFGVFGYYIFSEIIKMLFVIDFIAGTKFQSGDPTVNRHLMADRFYLDVLLIICSGANFVAAIFSSWLNKNIDYWVCAAVILLNVSLMLVIHHNFPTYFLLLMVLCIFIFYVVGAFVSRSTSKKSKFIGSS